MPTYEFRLPDGTIIEKIFKMSEVPETIPNPNGEGEAVRIISGGAGLLFKGTGFYITDYGKDGKKDQRSASNESAKAESSAPKADSGKSENAKAAKPDSTSGSPSSSSASTSSTSATSSSSPSSGSSSAPASPNSTPKKGTDS
ncbi:MAG: zinc ribbon domain-containing protein [Gemmatimonadaceae bacterium]